MLQAHLLGVLALGAASLASAYPGMADTMEEIKRSNASEWTGPELIGDLLDLDDDDLTKTGSQIKSLLLGGSYPQDLFTDYDYVPPMGSAPCKKDTCCIWKYVADDMHNAFVGTAGRCNNLARQAVRLGFHDAGAWSKKTGKWGGADGSVILAKECEERKENGGLAEVCTLMRTWHTKYEQYGVGMADLVQFGATVGTVSCPLGPRIRSFVGRKDNMTAAPERNLPGPKATADEILTMFADKTIGPAELVALLGAHTTSQQVAVDPSRAGDPQDSTPGVWDTAYFRETTDKNSPKRLFKFQSDINIANDPRTKPTWDSFRGPVEGQFLFNDAYARAYIRLSLLGVHNINDLTECTKVLPKFLASFTNPDEKLLQEFLDGKLPYAGEELQNGDEITE